MSEPSHAEQRLGLVPGSFPFESRYVEAGGVRLHHVDEGTGPTLLMLHGNPTWCFLYRHVIAALRDDYRCVALDLAGFGLSEVPPGFGHTPAEHARLVAEALEALDLRDAVLIAHDWGGPVGIAAMAATGRIGALCLGNTWAWPVDGDWHFEWFSRALGGPLGRWAARRHLIFVNGVMRSAMRRRKLTAEALHAYRAPFDEPARREGTHVFPREILGARVWLAALERKLRAFDGPVAFVWPENDIAFREKELARWRTLLPDARVERLPRCGHFLWEDAPEDCIAALRRVLPGLSRS